MNDSLPDDTNESEKVVEQFSNSEHKIEPSESSVESGKQKHIGKFAVVR